METIAKLSVFAKYAWGVLAYNVVVILWGVFLRASKSGDGCGQHWLTCHGEVIPSAPELKTIIEFSHRITSFLAFVSVLVLVIWAFRKFGKGERIRRTAVGSFLFVVTEGLVGAGLVLTGNTADALTFARPFWMTGHLLNTFILLMFLTSTAWFASGGRPLNFLGKRKYLLAIGGSVLAIAIVGATGSIAALATMLFPSESISAGITEDLAATSNILVRLRVLHPISSILVSVLLIFVAGWLARESGDKPGIRRWSNILSVLILLQVAFGAATLLTLGPIVMQLGHLLLADAIWISFVLLCLNFLSEPLQDALAD